MITHALGYQSKLFPKAIRETDLYAELKLTEIFRRRSTGLWYDPQDLTTLFQNTQGTLPVYRPGTGLVDPPVGLMLDKGQGLELGPELWNGVLTVTNSISGANGVYNATTGELSNTAVGTLGYFPSFINVNLGMELNKFYAVKLKFSGKLDKLFSVTLHTGSTSPAFNVGGISGADIRSGGGEAEYIGVNLVANPGIRINTNGTTTWSGLFIESISIREIKGYHAYQPTTTARPTLSGRYNLLTDTETLSTQSVTTAATNYTLSFSGTGTITLSGAATGTYSEGTRTITCTAGSLTLTVAGTVTKADLRVKRDGSSLPAYQSVTNATTYDTAGFPLFLKRDKVDDDLIVQAPAITGAWARGTIDGPVIGTVAIPAGEYHPLGGNLAAGLPSCTQWIAIDGTLSASEQNVFKRYVYSKARQLIGVYQFSGITRMSNIFGENSGFVTDYDFSNYDFSKVTNLENAFAYTPALTFLDTSSWALPSISSSCAGFARAASDPSPSLTYVNLSGLAPVKITVASAFLYKRSGLVTVDVSMLDFSQCTTLESAFFQCFSLENLIVGNAFDSTPCTNFTNAFISTKLSQASIDAILVSINNAGTSNGTFNQSGGSAPSATGQAAITAMRSRGWTVTVTGGF